MLFSVSRPPIRNDLKIGPKKEQEEEEQEEESVRCRNINNVAQRSVVPCHLCMQVAAAVHDCNINTTCLGVQYMNHTNSTAVTAWFSKVYAVRPIGAANPSPAPAPAPKNSSWFDEALLEDEIDEGLQLEISEVRRKGAEISSRLWHSLADHDLLGHMAFFCDPLSPPTQSLAICVGQTCRSSWIVFSVRGVVSCSTTNPTHCQRH